MHVRSVDVHVELQLLADRLDVLQSLLVVGSGTSDPDLDLVLNDGWCILADGLDDTLECGGDVGEVGNTATDEENLALVGNWGAEHEVQDGAGVVVSLRLGGRSRVLTVVGELLRETRTGDGVGVDDGRTTTSDESPDSAGGVKDGQLERSTSFRVELGDICLLLCQLTAERRRELHWWASVNVDASISRLDGGHTKSSWRACSGPFGTALELSSLVELGGQIQEEHFGGGGILIWDGNQWVDFQVCELAVYVDGVESGDEIDKNVMDTLWYLRQESSSNLVVRWVFC